MLKLALGIIVTASVIGALMPSDSAPAARDPAPAATARPVASVPGDGSGAVRIARQNDGHFYVDALVNGMPVRFLVDTGASVVALSVRDAQNAAVPVNPAQFEVIGSGASGEVRGQPVELGQLSIVGKNVTSVPAVVIDGGDQSLLGQSFLSRFDAVEIHGDELVLR